MFSCKIIFILYNPNPFYNKNTRSFSWQATIHVQNPNQGQTKIGQECWALQSVTGGHWTPAGWRSIISHDLQPDGEESFNPTFAYDRGYTLIGRHLECLLTWQTEEHIFLSQPMGFIDDKFPHHICLQNEALYKLKQAPCHWFKHLKEYLRSLDFLYSWGDPSLFTYSSETTWVFLFIYVDDRRHHVTGFDGGVVRSVLNKLGGEFATHKLGNLHYFLGIQFRLINNGLHLYEW